MHEQSIPMLSEHDSDDEIYACKRKPARSPRLGLALLVSVLANGLLSALLFLNNFKLTQTSGEDVSQFAGLQRNIPRQWTGNNVQSDEEWDQIWDNNSSYDAGIISLEDETAKNWGLPRSQRWPWKQTRGVYVLNAYHNLHCAHKIRRALDQFREGREQTTPWLHIQHCVLTWRDEILCNADDTPRYTGYQPKSTSGYGQVRMCRDWNKLQEWALDSRHAGCWKAVPGEDGVDGFHTIDRYRYCAEESEFKEDSMTKWIGDEFYPKST